MVPRWSLLLGCMQYLANGCNACAELQFGFGKISHRNKPMIDRAGEQAQRSSALVCADYLCVAHSAASYRTVLRYVCNPAAPAHLWCQMCWRMRLQVNRSESGGCLRCRRVCPCCATSRLVLLAPGPVLPLRCPVWPWQRWEASQACPTSSRATR